MATRLLTTRLYIPLSRFSLMFHPRLIQRINEGPIGQPPPPTNTRNQHRISHLTFSILGYFC